MPFRVRPDRFGKLREGDQPTVVRPPEPLAEMVFRPDGGAVVPEPAEVFLQQIGPHNGRVQPQEPREAGPFVPPEVLRILQPEEPRALEGGLLGLCQLPPHLLADRVDGVRSVAGEVESVEDHRGPRHSLPEHPQARAPYVAAHHADRASSAPPEPGEEALERALVLILTDPHHVPPRQVEDGGEVLLALPAAHLVETDHVQGRPPAMGKAPQDSGLDDTRHGLPVHEEIIGH